MSELPLPWPYNPPVVVSSATVSAEKLKASILLLVGLPPFQYPLLGENTLPAQYLAIVRTAERLNKVSLSVTISTPSDTVCQGTPVLFNAHPVNEGLTPIYQWKVNGVNSGANSFTFSYTPVNNDVVSCVLTSSYTACTTNNPATSNAVTMTVINNLIAVVSITAVPNPFCSGSTVNC